MGMAFNVDVDLEFSETTERDVIKTLKAPFDSGTMDKGFVLARVEDPSTACRISYIVVGKSPEAVQEFLREKTGQEVAPGALKHALEDVSTVFELARAAHLGRDVVSALNRQDLLPLHILIPTGCCSTSSGVSVLVVNKPEGAQEYRQVLLTNKFISCKIEGKTQRMERLSIQDAEAAPKNATFKSCAEEERELLERAARPAVDQTPSEPK